MLNHDADVLRLKRIAEQLKAMKPDMEALAGTQAAGCANIARRKVLCEDFTSTVQDIAICVLGEFERAYRSVGYYGGYYTVERVWLESDPKQTDIFALLTDEQVSRLEEEGSEIMSQNALEEAADAAEYLRDMER